MRPWLIALAVSVPTLSFPSFALAGDKPVATPAELAAALGAASPGDVIVLADGTYPMTEATCAAMGTAESPITVRSASPLGARIEFDATEGFHVTGAHWHFEGLDIRGVCASDDACEHAFHVTGGDAEGFILRKSRVRDFNAQLKVNADVDAGGQYRMANHGLVEYSEFFDTHPRATANPVTKLNIDGGVGWVVRGNYLHDFRKAGGNEVSYGAFMKSGGSEGLFERNLVACSKDDTSGGVRIGLSFGGGGTGAQYCAPAFDPNVPCAVEHTNGVMRNNVIVQCSDVGIYVNRGANTKILFNTLIATSGIDFRFDTTTGESHANLLAGKVRARDGATFAASDDVAEQSLDTFAALYADPLALDLSLKGDPSSLSKAAPHPALKDDYCARVRPSANLAVGALEHSLGSCTTLPPPEAPTETGAGGSGAASSTGGSTTGGGTAETGSGGTTATGTGGSAPDEDSPSATGCACRAAPSNAEAPEEPLMLAACIALAMASRRRRTERR